MLERVLYCASMAQSAGSARLWIGVAAAAGIGGLIAIGTWLATGGTQDGPERRVESSVPAPTPAPASHAAVDIVGSGIPRIAAQGRLTLDVAALPSAGLLTLDLELPDNARGSSERAVKIISTDGRRADTTARPLPGAGSGVRLELDPGFLTPGRYMIEIDTDDRHPLQIRRYVLELR